MTRILNRVQPRRRRKAGPIVLGTIIVIAALSFVGYKVFGHNDAPQDDTDATSPESLIAEQKPEAQKPTGTQKPTSGKSETTLTRSAKPATPPQGEKNNRTVAKTDRVTPTKDDTHQTPAKTETKRHTRENRDIVSAKKLIANGKLIEARTSLNRMLAGKLSPIDEEEVLKLLADLAEKTVFSKKLFKNDPLCTTYKIKGGDNLTVIGRRFNIPAGIIQTINGIPNPNRIRAGQMLKIPQGPFNVKIFLSQFRLDLYVGDTYVRSYRVAVGKDDGTPTGVWKVTKKLENPTYHPSESATDKRIIPGGNPENPLGTRWIGLEGIQGDAVGKTSFGIHGTKDESSIGKAVSLGCIRMRNEDVAFVFSVLTRNDSLVTILP